MSVIDAMPDGELDYIAQPLAEQVDPIYAMAAAEQYQTRRKPGGLLLSAWSHIELGLNQKLDYSQPVKDSNFAIAQQLVGEIVHDERTHEDTMIGAYVLASYLPLFHKRAVSREVDQQDCRQVYDSLGKMIAYLDPGGSTRISPWKLSESAVLALSARTSQPQLLLYPTSPREESSNVQRYNHDSYFYSDDSKYPIQQKFVGVEKEYDPSITMLTLQPLIDKATRVAGMQPCEGTTDRVSRILSLIVCETNGIDLNESEQRFLNFMSTAVAAHHAALSRRSNKATT